MNKLALTLAVIGAITASIGFYKLAKQNSKPVYEQQVLDNWTAYKAMNLKSYSNEDEENYRLSVFNENIKKIDEINSNPANTWTAGFNQFSDLSEEEFNATFNGMNADLHEEDPSIETIKESDNLELAGSVDWVATGGAQPAKNQGRCGSCWAFATIGSLETLDFVKNRQLRNFSEQQLVDCDKGSLVPPTPGDNGCHGGLPARAQKYTSWKGVALQSNYRYTGTEGTCKYNTFTMNAFKNWSYQNVQTYSSSALQGALQKGTVAIGIDGSCIQHYTGGIYNDGCFRQLNHAVLVVGYGPGYFKIKNSWGGQWGEQGCFRVAIPTESYSRGYIGMLSMMVIPN